MEIFVCRKCVFKAVHNEDGSFSFSENENVVSVQDLGCPPEYIFENKFCPLCYCGFPLKKETQ